ncbi:hypothetical protein [Synechococcus phage S-N03]|uniref:Sm-like domain-containing protein n=1 Tax=Synechococcus phage S-N03 TaxID=2718943 RepID=A0A6G8R626_9CAUD|nr:methylamine utilization [Synechococcus phage S-N03]QIN96846.1 hypothetical protein [Synechococcus phage S-N03]
MNDDLFFATIKMVTGEEVLAEVMHTEENGARFLILHNPIVMEETFDNEGGQFKVGQTARKWLQYATDDMVIVHFDKVLTMSEMNKYGAEQYKKYSYLAKAKSPVKKEMLSLDHSGYLGSIDEKRQYLEDMYNNSFDIPE